MTEPLDITITGPIAQITLARPELLNRFDHELHAALPDALGHINSTLSVRAVVLSSVGRVFSAGGDTAMMRAAHSDLSTRLEVHERGKRLVHAVLNARIPIVVALTGDVYGVGTTVVLNCDAVVAAPGLKIGDPHVRIGHVAGDGGAVAWPASVGLMRARRYLLTGDPVPSEVAAEWGMVTDLVESLDHVLPTAHAIADRIAALPPLAVEGTKRSLARVATARAFEVLDYSFAQQAITSASDDLMEAIDAFEQKRSGAYHRR